MNMDKIFFLNKPLRKVMDGHLFDVVFGWTLRCASFAMVIVLAVVTYRLWHETFFFNVAPQSVGGMKSAPVWMATNPDLLKILNSSLIQIVWIAVFFSFANILWLRSKDILEEKEDPDYNATPTLVFLLKAAGECYAVYLLGIFTIGAFSTWILANTKHIAAVTQAFKMSWLLPYLPKSPVILGLIVLVAGPILAILFVLCVYTVTEIVGSLVSIVRNTEKK